MQAQAVRGASPAVSVGTEATLVKEGGRWIGCGIQAEQGDSSPGEWLDAPARRSLCTAAAKARAARSPAPTRALPDCGRAAHLELRQRDDGAGQVEVLPAPKVFDGVDSKGCAREGNGGVALC